MSSLPSDEANPNEPQPVTNDDVLYLPDGVNFEMKEIDDLKDDPNQMRDHSGPEGARGVGMIKTAIEKVGTGRSIMTDDENVILGGHGARDGAKQAGIKKVLFVDAPLDVLVARRLPKGLTGQEKLFMAAVDNRAQELSKWDRTALKRGRDIGMPVDDLWTPTEFDMQTQDIDYAPPGVVDDEGGGGGGTSGEKRRGETWSAEFVEIAKLKPHPENYRIHSEEQIAHLMTSLREYGFWKPILISKDDFVLAGHGLKEAAERLGRTHVPVSRLPMPHDDIHALQVLAADNETSRIGYADDRLLTEILKRLNEAGALGGTGFDPLMLANLVMVTRPAEEIKDFDAAAAWAGGGVPEYDMEGTTENEITVYFDNLGDRNKFIRSHGIEMRHRGKKLYAHWPIAGYRDMESLRVVAGEDGVETPEPQAGSPEVAGDGLEDEAE